MFVIGPKASGKTQVGQNILLPGQLKQNLLLWPQNNPRPRPKVEQSWGVIS